LKTKKWTNVSCTASRSSQSSEYSPKLTLL
jgi:hypothetical protein